MAVHKVLPALLLLLSSCHAQPNADAERYAQYLAQAHARGQFNGAALVFEQGKVVYQGAFGIGNIDPIDSLHLGSQFRLASVGKQFTAMAIMILKEDGKLRYDQDVRDFLPELPYTGITIRHLLHHTSGLPQYEQMMDQHWKPELRYDDPARYISGNEDILDMYAAQKPPMRFQPGEKWEYSNGGYNLLGTIVKRASGMSYADFLQQRIFTPAGMAHSMVYPYVIGNDPAMPDRVFGFWTDWNGRDHKSTDGHYLNPAYGEDGTYSTVSDMLLWDRVLYTDKLVAKATLEEAFTPAVLSNGDTTEYGFGWFIGSTPTGKKMVAHSGSWAGFTTYFLRGIEEDKCLVVLTNNSTTYFGEDGIRGQLTNILYDRPYRLPRQSIRELLGKAVADEGAAQAIAHYHAWKQQRADDINFSEGAVNVLGYELLESKRVDDAVAILQLNMEEYPNSANVYDSYGDALVAKGDTANALVHFKKALALDPSMTATQEKIDGIEKGK